MTFQYTTFQLGELIKCANYPIYFIENYVTIDTPDGPTLLKLSEAQKEVIREMEQSNLCAKLMERATGKTTVALAYIAHQVIFRSRKNVVIIGTRTDAAKTMLRILAKIIIGLPDFIRPKFTVDNRTTFKLENESQVFVVGANSYNSLRGMIINFLYMDEVEYFDHRVKNEIFDALIPVIASRHPDAEQNKFLSLSSGYPL